MSAFVVDVGHIDALVAAGLRNHWGAVDPGSGLCSMRWQSHPNRGPRELRHDNATAVGAMLLEENIRSVAHRYEESDRTNLPGPIPIPLPEEYTHDVFFSARRKLNPVAVLKALDCYEYQTCEHPEWHESEAFQFCDVLRRRMIHELPGYEESSWEVSA